MNILEQCKMCEKRPMCRLGEHEYYQAACEHGCPSFKQKQKKNVPITNFDLITESPEALAEQLVYSGWEEHIGIFFSGIARKGIRHAYKTRKKAVAVTLEWLNKEAKK